MVCSLLASVFFNAYDRNFYVREYDKYALASYTGLNRNDYQQGMDTLLDYLQDKQDDIEVNVEMFGSNQSLFNQREIDHMVDVKVLANNAFHVMIICGGITMGIVIILWLNHKLYLRSYKSCFIGFHLVLIGLLIGLAMMIVGDFNAFWTTFHHIFFPGNDLWLLDPATDAMIRMLPSELFMDLVIRILVTFIISYGLIHGLNLWLNHHYLKKEDLK